MNNKILSGLTAVFKGFSQIKLVYFFGSKAQKKSGPLSDYDFAFYFNERNHKKLADLKLELFSKLSEVLKTDKIDIVVLNTSENPELKYNIIKEGRLIYEIEPFKVIVEPHILNEYFDFYMILKKYNLTKA